MGATVVMNPFCLSHMYNTVFLRSTWFFLLDYLSVNTELLLITDGRSNDPKKFGLKLDKIKEKFTSIGVQVSAIGVGKINEREIQAFLTIDKSTCHVYVTHVSAFQLFRLAV